MQYLNKSFSVPPPAKTTGCCEGCVYGGRHADWCEIGIGESEKLRIKFNDLMLIAGMLYCGPWMAGRKQ